jgi:hypothetical protein
LHTSKNKSKREVRDCLTNKGKKLRKRYRVYLDIVNFILISEVRSF